MHRIPSDGPAHEHLARVMGYRDTRVGECR